MNMPNRWHYLKANKGTTSPSQMSSFWVEHEQSRIDSESGKTLRSFRSVAWSHWRIYKGQSYRERSGHSSARDTFWQAILGSLQRKRPTWCWGYSCGKQLTLLGLWQLIDDGVLKLNSLVDADPPTIINCTYDGKKIIFVDLQNWFRVPFASLIDNVMADDSGDSGTLTRFDGFSSNCEFNNGIVRETVQGVVSFVHQHDLGRLRFTAPSQALQAYRHRFGPSRSRTKIIENGVRLHEPMEEKRILPVIHNDPQAKELEKRSYFGGQTSCFFVGRILSAESDAKQFFTIEAGKRVPSEVGPIYHLDVNSLFPSVMKGKRHPSKLLARFDDGAAIIEAYNSECHCICADVHLSCSGTTYPVRREGAVYYANGDGWVTLIGDELRQAFALGQVNDIGECAIYETDLLFDRFCDYLWAVRVACNLSDNHLYSGVAKLLLNSLYGKFGQQNLVWKEKKTVDAKKRWGRWLDLVPVLNERHSYRAIAGLVQEELPGDNTAHTFIALASSITSAARHRMTLLREAAGRFNVFYQGIDSLLVNRTGYDRLMSHGEVKDGEMGAMRLLGTFATGQIFNDRYYRLEDKLTLSGIPADHEMDDRDGYSFSVLPSLRGLLDSKPDPIIVANKVIAHLTQTYRGGRIRDNGWVEPFDFKELPDGE